MVRIFVLTLPVLIAFQAATLTAQEIDPRAAFAQAYALYTAGRFAQAKELLLRITDPKYPLADYSLYYLAAISSD